LVVDPNVGEGTGVDPAVAGTEPGKAIVAYRVVTKAPSSFEIGLLRPGDVIADFRVARLESDRWSRLGAINRFPGSSVRAPSETNGPQVAIGATGRAVVAWQEPEPPGGAARIWMRRVTGTTLGPILAASPSTWEGQPVSEDVTAFSLAVTSQDEARVAALVEGGAATALGGQRIFMTTLGAVGKEGAKPSPPVAVDGGGSSAPPGPLGPPTVSAADAGGTEGSLRLAFSAPGGVHIVGAETSGALTAPTVVAGPQPLPDGEVAAAVDPEGGGVIAYTAADPLSVNSVAVLQEFPDGSSQSGVLYGPVGGAISNLHGSGSGTGDALFAFQQGESGLLSIAAGTVVASPGSFALSVPEHWVLPGKARISWAPAAGATGQDIEYSVLLNGRIVRSGVQGLVTVPPRQLLGSGTRQAQVIATDQFGQQTFSRPAKLRVDSQPPALRIKARGESVRVTLTDAQSGLRPSATYVNFGDGKTSKHHARARHVYAAPGVYTIQVRARDRVGNRLRRRVKVKVG
jgi:hypothetical protein